MENATRNRKTAMSASQPDHENFGPKAMPSATKLIVITIKPIKLMGRLPTLSIWPAKNNVARIWAKLTTELKMMDCCLSKFAISKIVGP